MIEYGFVYQCCFDTCPTRNGWINGTITFEIDHIDGNNIDNRPENLRFICAICHSQQPTSTHSWKTSEKYSAKSRCECGKSKSPTAVRCVSCYADLRRSTAQPVIQKTRPTKIVWPDLQTLESMLSESNYTEVARQLGVSDNAIRKHIKSRAVDGGHDPVI